MIGHNPYFNRWFSAILKKLCIVRLNCNVTILILIDGFLQYWNNKDCSEWEYSHNPYFNRWFSAMGKKLYYSIK